jgi:hypothetical protein
MEVMATLDSSEIPCYESFRQQGMEGVVNAAEQERLEALALKSLTKMHIDALSVWKDGRYLLATLDASMAPRLLKEAHGTRIDEGHLPMVEAVLCGGVPSADVCRRALDATHAATNMSVMVSDVYTKRKDRAVATHLLKMLGC